MTCHSYDVIKLLSKKITRDCGVFIPGSIGGKIIKKRPRYARVIVKNKVAHFFGHGVYVKADMHYICACA